MKQEISDKYKGSYTKYIRWCNNNRGKKTKKLNTEEYRHRSEFFLSMLTYSWWTGLVAFIYNSKPIKSECYWRILETMEYIYKLKLYRGNKKHLLNSVIYKRIEFNKQKRSTHDWWGEDAPNDVTNEIKNEIDNIIDVLSHNTSLTPKQYLDKYIETLENRWQK